jgi:hypothetical protein
VGRRVSVPVRTVQEEGNLCFMRFTYAPRGEASCNTGILREKLQSRLCANGGGKTDRSAAPITWRSESSPGVFETIRFLHR